MKNDDLFFGSNERSDGGRWKVKDDLIKQWNVTFNKVFLFLVESSKSFLYLTRSLFFF